MSIKAYISILLVFGLFLPFAAGFDYSGTSVPGVQSGPTQKNYRSGLRRSPDPIDRSNNLVITGNVTGGKQFRGLVPYNATSTFGAPVGSSVVDPLLRRSGTLLPYEDYLGVQQPYFSGTKTVTKMVSGRTGVYMPTSVRAGGWSPQGYSAELPPPHGSILGKADIAATSIRTRPISRPPMEVRRQINEEISRQMLSIQLTPEQKKALDEKFVERMETEGYLAILRKEEPSLESRLKPEEYNPEELRAKPFELKVPPKPEELKQGVDEPTATIKVLEEIRRELEDIELEKKELEGKKPTAQEELIEKLKSKAKEEEGAQGKAEEKQLSDSELSLRAEGILGKYKNLESFKKARFAHHMAAAAEFMKEGKFYRAENSFDMALVYHPDDPVVYGGKSQALFAAGEYMSSAYFLSEALRLSPAYAKVKVDLAAVSGGRDMVESRLAEIEKFLKDRDIAQLRFLAAYGYYQIGRIDAAKKNIEAAYEKLGDDPAVIALRDAISSQ